MLQMQGFTLGQLIEIYDNATPDEKQWTHDNIREWE